MEKTDHQWANSRSSESVLPSEIATTKSTADLFPNTKEKWAGENPTHPERDYLCGVFSFRPSWMQKFAHPRWYFVNYVMMGILSGAYKTYLVGTLSTIERRFQMSNSTTAIILIADNISPIFINVLAGYYANRISRPKLMSVGSIIVVASCVISMLPFLIYGPGVATQDMTRSKIDQRIKLCHNSSLENLPDENSCSGSDASISWLPFWLFLAANFLNGSGGSVFFVVGSTYMDDNIKKKNSPFYFSLSFALRLLGPVLGFLTSAFCLSYNEDIFNGAPRSLNPRDPRWIGAWWLGYLFFGTGLSLVAIPMMFFPRILPMGRDQKANRVISKSVTGKGAPRDMFSAVRRLIKNPIFVLKSLGFVFIIIGAAGYGTTFTKYVEHQFGRSPASASFISGTSKVLTNMLGIMAGGIAIQLLRPSPRKVAACVAIVEVIYMLGYVWLLFVGCQSPTISGMSMAATGRADSAYQPQKLVPFDPSSFRNDCNAKCSCSPNDFAPVCSPDGRTLFSACYAGCNSSVMANNGTLVGYKDCACIEERPIMSGTTLEPTHHQTTVTPGFCGSECTTLMLYLTIVIICQLVGSTARSGSMLLYLRCVDPTDKSMALGVSSSFINLVAFIPYPLIYGYVLDKSCILWSKTCNGTKGSCKLYDIDKLRYSVHLTTIGFLFVAVICYIAVVFYAHRIKHFYSEPDDGVDGGVYNSEKKEKKNDDNNKLRNTTTQPIASIEKGDQKTNGKFCDSAL